MQNQTLVQLLYTSRLLFDASEPQGWSRVQDIVNRASERNSAARVSGFLLVGKDWAAQILEGDERRVNATFHRILRDPRHTDIHLVDIRMITERMFAGWSMGASHRPLADMPSELMSCPVDFAPVSFDEILAMARSEAERTTPAR